MSLSDFLDVLEDQRELVRIPVEVDPVLELAAIVDRVGRSPGGGPALFFEDVRGSTVPVVANLLGSESRMCRALQTESLEALAGRIAGLVQPDLPEGWLEALRLVPQFAQLARLPPRTVRAGVCQQVVRMGRDVDLGELPVPHGWPGETAPTITAAHVHLQNPATGIRHVGAYPLEVVGRNALTIQWDPHQEGGGILAEHQRLGRQMPVAVCLGGDPAYVYMARAPLPPNTDACLFGGFLRDANLELVKCRSIDLHVPADCEIVIEGYIDTADPLAAGGPVAAPTGFYGEARERPLIRVTALTHRSNPVFPAMVTARPPSEDCWIGAAHERIFLPLVRLFLPELCDLHFPWSGAFRNLLFVSIRKQYPQQARKVIHALWGLGWLGVSKFIVAVDGDVDVHDEGQVWFHVGAHAHPGRDTIFCEGPTHYSDHAAPVPGLGHKLGIDATRKLPDEGHPRAWPEPLSMPAEIRERISGRWGEYGFPA